MGSTARVGAVVDGNRGMNSSPKLEDSSAFAAFIRRTDGDDDDDDDDDDDFFQCLPWCRGLLADKDFEVLKLPLRCPKTTSTRHALFSRTLKTCDTIGHFLAQDRRKKGTLSYMDEIMSSTVDPNRSWPPSFEYGF
ncbi:hypothetical protein AYO21_02425 [Fonsecaea monophora]|uniref:Uncharacterized protein n=1 Tax=Fonsecaea monophora TaxID=254056 RepID=A0A177FGX2_9EURO|nr:hypothetical protein AYO21_02425 [Fonsecaea monophora]OAG43488.1 hypothetical protein AYO21_02425 [Fonsecaea monophora]